MRILTALAFVFVLGIILFAGCLVKDEDDDDDAGGDVNVDDDDDDDGDVYVDNDDDNATAPRRVAG